MPTARKAAARKTVVKKAAAKKPVAKKPAAKKAPAKKAPAKPGLYANIQAKRERIAHGSGEHMRQPGEDGAPASDAFDKAAKKKAAPKH